MGSSGGNVLDRDSPAELRGELQVMRQNSRPSRVSGCFLMTWNHKPSAWSLTQRSAERGVEGKIDRAPLSRTSLMY